MAREARRRHHPQQRRQRRHLQQVFRARRPEREQVRNALHSSLCDSLLTQDQSLLQSDPPHPHPDTSPPASHPPTPLRPHIPLPCRQIFRSCDPSRRQQETDREHQRLLAQTARFAHRGGKGCGARGDEPGAGGEG